MVPTCFNYTYDSLLIIEYNRTYFWEMYNMFIVVICFIETCQLWNGRNFNKRKYFEQCRQCAPRAQHKTLTNSTTIWVRHTKT